MLLEFDNILANTMRTWYMSYEGKDFIPALLSCFRCQRMGHNAGQSKGKQRCAICGGEHENRKCGKNVKMKC